jgi:hypothetical protein
LRGLRRSEVQSSSVDFTQEKQRERGRVGL